MKHTLDTSTARDFMLRFGRNKDGVLKSLIYDKAAGNASVVLEITDARQREEWVQLQIHYEGVSSLVFIDTPLSPSVVIIYQINVQQFGDHIYVDFLAPSSAEKNEYEFADFQASPFMCSATRVHWTIEEGDDH